MVRSIVSQRVAQHKNPVPNAAIHGNMLVTSGILGKDLQSGEYASDKAEQIALVFDYLETILDEAGVSVQNVVKVDLYFADKDDRQFANLHWLRLWPDADRRPARQAHQADLPNGCCMQMVAMAVLDDPV